MSMKKGLSRYKNPKIVGAGIWYCIHMLVENAVNSRDPNDFNLAYKYIVTIRDNFPCLVCKRHIEMFCEAHPLEDFKARYSDGKMVEEPKYEYLSKWAYDLHAQANQITNSKYNESYDDVVDFFRSNEACVEDDCGNNDDESEEDNEVNDTPVVFVPPTHLKEPSPPTLTIGNGAIKLPTPSI